MAFSSADSKSLSATPNVTPLIDVLLVLLIIFMVIVPMTPRGLDTIVPGLGQASAPPMRMQPAVLGIAPAASGKGIQYELNQRILAPAELSSALRRVAATSADRALHIQGDPALDFQPVAGAVSEAKLAGFSTIVLLPQRLRATGNAGAD